VPTGPVSLEEIVGAGATPPGPDRRGRKRRRDTLRRRVLPRSVLGISSLILAFAVGAGFSGVVLYSYYQYKLNQTNSKVNALVSGYKSQFAKAEANLNADVSAAEATIASQQKALQQSQPGPQQLAALVKQVAPAAYFVHTLDSSGQASVGAAFGVSSDASQTLLITSYSTVAAATHAPAPPIYVRQGSTDTEVKLQTWDPQYDLALLILPKGHAPVLGPAPSSPSPQPGDRLYVVSGLGSAGASLVPATVVDVSTSGLTLDAAIGEAFQGGPVVNQEGQVIGVGSRNYSPQGFSSDGIFYTPYVEAACNKVLSCPGGTLPGSH
jgi:S1-C subfamily serine protease